MVSTFYPPYHFGGDAVFVQSLGRALVARGHRVEVVHCEDAYRLSATGPEPAAADDDGIIVHKLRSGFGLLSPLLTQQIGGPGFKRSAWARIFESNFDVVNFHNISLVGGLGILPMSKAEINLYTLHEHWLLCPTHIFWKNRKEPCDKPECIRCCLKSGIPPQLWRHRGLLKRSLQHVDVLLSPSAYTARRHQEADLGRPIRILPTFSPVDPGDEAGASGPERPRFIYVGRVTASKGVDRLVNHFAGLPQYDLDIIGAGDLLLDLRRRYAACGWIRFLGSVEHSQVAQYYRNATAMILPSRAPEVFPLCVLEAFACGLPVIVSDAGGNREAVDRSGAGFVYRTEAELLNAVTALAGQPQLRDTLALRARSAYKKFYSEDRYLDEYLALIDEIRAGKSANREEIHPVLP